MRPGFGLKNALLVATAGAVFAGASAAVAQTETPAGAGVIIRLDPRFDALVPAGATIEKVADGFVFLEGPVWRSADSRLFFSDLRGNAIYQWTAAEGVSDVAKPFFTVDGTGLRGIGPNGIALDAEGRLLVVRVRQPLRHSSREGRQPHDTGRPLRRQAPQQPERSRRRTRRHRVSSRTRRSAWKAWTTRRCASWRSTASIASGRTARSIF